MMFPRRGLIVGVLCLFVVVAVALPSWANQLDDAFQQQQNLINQKSQAQNKLGQLTYSEDVIRTELAELEKRIATAEALLNERRAAFLQAQKDVEEAEAELALKQLELEKRQEVMGERAKAIYEAGQVSYVEMLFQASNLSDFINRVEYFSMLMENDRQLLLEVQRQKEELTRKAMELQQKRNQAAQLEAQAVSAKRELDQASSRQTVALQENRKAQLAEIENIQRMEAEANALNERIRRLQAARGSSGDGTITTWPLDGHYRVSSRYGWRIHPTQGGQSFHTGIDLPAATGTPITAAGAGDVLVAGWNTAYGYMVIIDHGKGISTLYGHMSAMNVTEGRTVQAGQVIGYVGSTGWSTGPHLHFEIRENGNATDPLRYFPF